MKEKTASGILITLLLIGTLTLMLDIRMVKASETIYIRANGSIDPPTANITSADNVTYYFTDNNYDEIVVQRSNIIVDGNGYTLQGSGTGWGFYLSSVNNVTIQNTNIKNFTYGVYFYSSSNNTVSGNNITNNNRDGVRIYSSSNNNTVSGNNITNNTNSGVSLSLSSLNTVSGNNITNNNSDGIRLSSSSFNTISGNNIAGNNNHGIELLSSSNNNAIYGNNIAKNKIDGVVLSFSSNNNVSENDIANNTNSGVYFSSSSFNTVSGNNIANNGKGAFLSESSNNNTLSGNNVTNNDHGVDLSLSSNNKVYHNNFIDNKQQVFVSSDSLDNVWDDGYPSGGNYWSDYTGADVMHGPNQDQHGSDGIGDTPYVIDANNQDNYPWMNPSGAPPSQIYNLTITTTVGGTTDPSAGTYSYAAGSSVKATAIPDENYSFNHWELDGSWNYSNPISIIMDTNHTLHAVFIPDDVALTNITLSKTVVCQSFSMFIYVTAENQGGSAETFNVTAYADTTLIGTQTISNLPNGTSTTITFTWNTTGFAKGNYTISANATVLPGETDVADNNLTDGWVIVSYIGDISGPAGWPDGLVDIDDVTPIALAFASTLGPDGNYWHTPPCDNCPHNPNNDITNDGLIDIDDVIIPAIHFAETDP